MVRAFILIFLVVWLDQPQYWSDPQQEAQSHWPVPGRGSEAQSVVTVVDPSSDQLALVINALESFDDAGLSLADVEIRFSEDPADCAGHLGVFSARAQPWAITICSDLPFVPTHELAHVWIESHVSEQQRETYRAARLLPTWSGSTYPWKERAVEHAAFIIQQNVTMSPRQPLSDEWVDRAAAYRLLTGIRSPVRDPGGGTGFRGVQAAVLVVVL